MLVDEAQYPSNTIGSIIRVTTDGDPLISSPNSAMNDAVLAYGFKNPQGLAIDPKTGAIWATDHGGVGGGELNLIEMGGNYGWPVRSFGVDNGPRAAAVGDFVEPVFTWDVSPTVAFSGLEIYTGDDFEFWQGDLFADSLLQSSLIRIMLDDGGNVVGTDYVLDGEVGRVREVRQGPDGLLYVLNDEPDGGIFRISPKP